MLLFSYFLLFFEFKWFIDLYVCVYPEVHPHANIGINFECKWLAKPEMIDLHDCVTRLNDNVTPSASYTLLLLSVID